MPRGPSGRYESSTTAGETVRAFIPDPLPPEDIFLSSDVQRLNELANRALGRLDMATTQLPELGQFLYFYIRKEALLSSQIEGTQSSFADLILFENNATPGVPLDDVREVVNYVAAIEHGLTRMRKDNFPLCVRLIKEIHAILLRKGRGEDKTPGEFRRSQNWIGGTRPGNARFVPPPHPEIAGCMSDLERFIHDDEHYIPALLKAGLVHVQFETIHPFLDGNGRVGRLLIPLLLCSEKVLKEPVLYLSVYFKSHRDEYYNWLQKIRIDGDWEGWLRFFLQGIIETADQAVETTLDLQRLFESDRKRIDTLAKAAGSALRVHDDLQRHPITSVSEITKRLSLAFPTVNSAVKNLEKLGIVKLLPGQGARKRNKFYSYSAYIAILDKGTEPLS